MHISRALAGAFVFGLLHVVDGAMGAGASLPSEPTPLPKAAKKPLRWRLGNVDPRFGLTRAEARQAILEATRVWQGISQDRLFIEDTAKGFPVNWIYDSRQEKLASQSRLRKAAKETKVQIERDRIELERQKRIVADAFDEYRAQLSARNQKVDQYNAEVRYWNVARNTPPEVREKLDALRREIESEKVLLEASLERARSLESAVSVQVDQFNEKVHRFNRTAKESESSAFFHEKVGLCLRRGSSPIEIRIFAFETRQDMTRTLAHEFGHALGLGHVSTPQSIMSATSNVNEGAALQLTAADIKLFSKR